LVQNVDTECVRNLAQRVAEITERSQRLSRVNGLNFCDGARKINSRTGSFADSTNESVNRPEGEAEDN
jgi:hypothetical protein